MFGERALLTDDRKRNATVRCGVVLVFFPVPEKCRFPYRSGVPRRNASLPFFNLVIS